MSQWQQFWCDWIEGATELTSIAYSSSVWGGNFLADVLGFPIITQMDEDVAIAGRRVLQFLPSVNNYRVNNRVHNVMIV
jgi:hypothetical protein